MLAHVVSNASHSSQVVWMSFGWWTILDTHGKLLSVKNPVALQFLTQWTRCTWHLLLCHSVSILSRCLSMLMVGGPIQNIYFNLRFCWTLTVWNGWYKGDVQQFLLIEKPLNYCSDTAGFMFSFVCLWTFSLALLILNNMFHYDLLHYFYHLIQLLM
jgi:hypothetical protein